VSVPGDAHHGMRGTRRRTREGASSCPPRRDRDKRRGEEGCQELPTTGVGGKEKGLGGGQEEGLGGGQESYNRGMREK
jgi:hypothetical protein